MRYALVSDIHANLEALEAVLAAIDRERVDRILCLGDVVGYGASPNECVKWLAVVGAMCVAGNHDRAAIGLRDTSTFGRAARRAMTWTRRLLTAPSHDYLAALPLVRTMPGGVLLFHAALHPSPNDELHLSTLPRIEQSLRALRDDFEGARVGLFGHTHRPGAFRARGGAFGPAPGERVLLDEGAHYLVNPGSVGQPRDGDPRASFAILDTGARCVKFCRTNYDAALAMAKLAAVSEGRGRRAFGFLSARLRGRLFAGEGR